MLLQKTTTENLQEVIKMNGGVIATSQLATVLGKSHQHLTDKLAKSCTLTNFVTVQESYNSGKNTRTAYLLPEKEAMALAMSYDMNLGMKVYQAFQDYKAALEAVQNATSLAEAKAIAKEALNVRIFEAIGSKHGKVGSLLNEAFIENTPAKANALIRGEYRNQANVLNADIAYRKKFLEAWIRSIDTQVVIAKEAEDFVQVLALGNERGKVIAIQKHILEYNLTKAEQRIKQLEAKEQTPEVKAELAAMVQEASNVIPTFTGISSFFTAEDIAASIKTN
ncbi:Rha family transcriptional regulator [Enterovibrio calviensis]|uniref:hypothetical protein n=1 Tax=Enterovibrio calviensis TaxID=91359 RepID=UPI000480824D|nr:hypothetical protein [Enterovibrio calviensis]